VGIDDLCQRVEKYSSLESAEFVRRSYEYAAKAHSGQLRSSGEHYIVHPLAVATILAEMELDAITLAAAFLHDVVEDTANTKEDILKLFGQEVASLVDGVTKVKKLENVSKEEQQAESLRKMFMAVAKDIRVLLIKLADRLHNMRTLKYQSEEKQVRTAQETVEIYAPLAHRLGISTIQWELEDISLRFMNPQQYYRIVHLMTKKRREREAYVQEVIDSLREKIKEIDIKADLAGRAKHINSIYRKMTEQHKEFNEIYDLMAVRVIVDNIKDCYAILGIVHTLWKPMPGRFKDYIAMPKANMYQSLHTTVIGPLGEPLEIQIRTWEMHRTAEYGIAAHWVYKEHGGRSEGSFAQKLAWFREILEWQQDFKDAQEFMETLKIDLFADEVFVFTPKGDVIELSAGSVPIDFAYRIHTDIGNRCVGAKVNGKIVTLDYKLRTGDIVEVLTSKQSFGPSRDWLKIVKSSQAKSKIRLWFKNEDREANIAKGRDLLEKEAVKHRIEPRFVLADKAIADVIHKFNFSREEDLFASIGYGGVSAAQVVTRVLERLRKESPELFAPLAPEVRELKPRVKASNGVRVRGADNLLIRFSRCCNPVPGDDIVGFITRGRGISIHRRGCPNLSAESTGEETRLIEVEWESSLDDAYNVDIEITGSDRSGLLNEVMNVVAETKTNITAVVGKTDKRRIASIYLSITIRNVDHLNSVVERIKRVRDVYTVRRVMQ